MKKRLFIDTNIMLDLLSKREPFYQFAGQLATLADERQVIMIVSPLSFATINYLLSKYESPTAAMEKLRKFKIISEICRIDEAIVEKGLHSNFSDFEDALQYYSAIAANCEIIITRNGKDFKNSSIPIMTAEEYLISVEFG